MNEEKKTTLNRLSDENGIISALAFDQRGALRKLMKQFSEEEPSAEKMARIKTIVAEELTPYASAMLLDPEYGLTAAKALAKGTGLLLAYEKTGYDVNSNERMPDCLPDWSVRRLKDAGADAVKFLLYYDADGDAEVNRRKQAYIERIGAECTGEGLPFFLELLAYDEDNPDVAGPDYALAKPHKVIGAMKVFSQPRFGVDVLKVEVPVNMNYVEGFGKETIYTERQAREWFLRQEEAASLPYIYLSAGVSADLFRRTLMFAAESGARFSGVLCGRATWAGSIHSYMQLGEGAARRWLRHEGRNNIEALNEVLKQTAVPWFEK
ncbi:MAG: tagatose-bisphosphate aldolase [Solobacterium sp.]|nr:tagatose-bisphosphate aldolase [Solobacterium sp.]